jgi:hypothetical protein
MKQQQLVEEVVMHGLRPKFPPHAPYAYVSLAQACWSGSAAARPLFEEVRGDLLFGELLFGALLYSEGCYSAAVIRSLFFGRCYSATVFPPLLFGRCYSATVFRHCYSAAVIQRVRSYEETSVWGG